MTASTEAPRSIREVNTTAWQKMLMVNRPEYV